MFDQAQQDKINEAIEPYVNVELDHFTPYLEGTPALTLRRSRRSQAQERVRSCWTPVVQAVLTDEDADIDALLSRRPRPDVNTQLAQQSSR